MPSGFPKNGRTLCIDCHRKTDTYDSKFFKKRELVLAENTK